MKSPGPEYTMSRPSKRSRGEELRPSSPTTSEGRAAKSTHFPVSPSQFTKSVDVNFRSLSTCNRCRMRKHRCDQRLPACANCEKVGTPCMGYDPVTKKEIPRSYVHHLETRVATLESILDQRQIPYPQANATTTSLATDSVSNTPRMEHHPGEDRSETRPTELDGTDERPRASDMSGIEPVQVTLGNGSNSDSCTSSISFAHVAFSDVRSSVAVSCDPSRDTVTQRSLLEGTKFEDHRAVQLATPFPDRALGLRLVHLYFHHSNPMYPILHRKDFRMLFDRACASQQCTTRERFLLYIVFAIGAGIHLTGDNYDWDGAKPADKTQLPDSGGGQDSRQQLQPEDYYATAITYLESFLTSSTGRRQDRGLEELQAVLLLAAFALLRPASPGLWYIIGTALRRAVDLGLYSDDQGLPTSKNENADSEQTIMTRDFRRRLWWCAYSFDRLISACARQPCSVPDSIITTEFPSLLDDDFISPNRFDTTDNYSADLSYKHVSNHYFRLRVIQSEILQVTQAIQAQRAREQHNRNHSRPHGARGPFHEYHGELSPSLLQSPSNLKLWRDDMERRLEQWRDSVPEESTSGVTFPTEYFDLNYWQTIIMLYSDRQQTTPSGYLTAVHDHKRASSAEAPWAFDEIAANATEHMFLRIAEAGRAVLRVYRELHLRSLVNYTYLDTHQLFTASNSFLSAVWLSPAVRQRFSVEDVDLTVLAATSVLNDLVEKCPHAAACRDAIQNMSKTTLKRCRLSRKGTSSSSRRRLPPQRAEDTLLSSFPDHGSPPAAASHVSSGYPSHTGPFSSTGEGVDPNSLSNSGTPRLRPRHAGDGTGLAIHSSFNHPFAHDDTIIVTDTPVFSNGQGLQDEHQPAIMAPPLVSVGELDRSGIAIDLEHPHHDQNDADDLLNMSWNDHYLSFDPSAQVGLFDGFFFGDASD